MEMSGLLSAQRVGALIDLNITQEAIRNARASIIKIANDYSQETQGNLASKFLRLAFHDAIGGPDGCVDLSNPDNFGLEIPILALQPVAEKYAIGTNSGLSRADIWALAGLTGIDMSTNKEWWPIEFPLQFVGRVDCDDPIRITDTKVNTNGVPFCRNSQGEDVPCSYDVGPHRMFPTPDFTTHQLLNFFQETFGFSARQTVVIMGAHTIGFASRQNSGFDGKKGWVTDPNTFDNNYYQQLIGLGTCAGDYVENARMWNRETMQNEGIVGKNNVTIPDRFVWTRRGQDNIDIGDPLVMLTSDIALVRDFEVESETKEVKCTFLTCPFASKTGYMMAEYSKDNEMFLYDFRDTFNLMITQGYDTTHADKPPDTCLNCLTQVDFSITTNSPSKSPETAQPTINPSASLPTSSQPPPTPTPTPMATQSSSSSHPHVFFSVISAFCCAIIIFSSS